MFKGFITIFTILISLLKAKGKIIICNNMLIICKCVIRNPDQEDAVQQLRELPSQHKTKTLHLCLCSLTSFCAFFFFFYR